MGVQVIENSLLQKSLCPKSGLLYLRMNIYTIVDYLGMWLNDLPSKQKYKNT